MKARLAVQELTWMVLFVCVWPTCASAIDALTQFEGLANSDNVARFLPPDNGLAAGPSHLFEMVNS